MTTVVTGAGLIGTAFAQNAIARGEKVVFVDPEPARRLSSSGSSATRATPRCAPTCATCRR